MDEYGFEIFMDTQQDFLTRKTKK